MDFGTRYLNSVRRTFTHLLVALAIITLMVVVSLSSGNADRDSTSRSPVVTAVVNSHEDQVFETARPHQVAKITGACPFTIISGDWGDQYLRVQMGVWWLGLRPIGDPIPEEGYLLLELADVQWVDETDHSFTYSMDGTLTWSATNYVKLYRWTDTYTDDPEIVLSNVQEWFIPNDLNETVNVTSGLPYFWMRAFFSEESQHGTLNDTSPWWELDAAEDPENHPDTSIIWANVIQSYEFSDTPFE